MPVIARTQVLSLIDDARMTDFRPQRDWNNYSRLAASRLSMHSIFASA